MIFYPGLHQPSDAKHFERAFISVNRLRRRVSDFEVGRWIMDSGAFTEITRHGHYRTGVEQYAQEISRWASCGTMEMAVSQDWMCEPEVLRRTGSTVGDHQRWTVGRYLALRDASEHTILPVLQGWTSADYLRHLDLYGDVLTTGMRVGVGSICRRNGDAGGIAFLLGRIHATRPDLKLHGFGLKLTALQHAIVRRCLYSADSMAWSFAARRQGRNPNDWREAKRFTRAIDRKPTPAPLFEIS